MSLSVPENFAMVTQGVYRSSYPTKKTLPFLKRIGVRSIVYLCLEEYTDGGKKFLEENNIRLFPHGTPGNKEPFDRIDETAIYSALQTLLDVNNHPVVVHCNKGKHRTGCLIGCYRGICGWTYSAIFEEYRRHAGGKFRRSDQQFIELFVRKYPKILVRGVYLPQTPSAACIASLNHSTFASDPGPQILPDCDRRCEADH